jgi:hypothetical protein
LTCKLCADCFRVFVDRMRGEIQPHGKNKHAGMLLSCAERLSLGIRPFTFFGEPSADCICGSEDERPRFGEMERLEVVGSYEMHSLANVMWLDV